MSYVTAERCRQVLTEGVDKILNHRWLSMLSSEQNAVLMAARSVVVADDAVVTKIAAAVGPYSAAPAPTGEIVEGDVQSVRFSSGREDGLLEVTLAPPPGESWYGVWLFVRDPKSEITLDGHAVSPDVLLSQLFFRPCRVKAWPLAERYGAALRAEFTTL